MPHGHRKEFQIDETVLLTLSTLGSKTAIVVDTNIDSSRAQGFYILYTLLAGFFAGKTTAEGPITIGLCANLNAADLTAIMIEDRQRQESPSERGPGSWVRPIVLVGLDALEGEINGAQGDENVQGTSRYMLHKVNWTIPEGDAYSLFAFNHMGSALTTGMTVTASMINNGRWLRD